MTMHFQEQQERDETGIPTAKQGKQLFTRGELTGMGMALCLLVYGLFQQDIPLVFLTSSFLVFEAHSFFAQSGSPQGKNISNLLKGFSIALFAGSLIILLYS
mgnify:CR=1 FL=1